MISTVYRHHAIFDALWSTVLITNGLSGITDRYAYDAWGEVDHVSGSTTDNPYLYVGRSGGALDARLRIL